MPVALALGAGGALAAAVRDAFAGELTDDDVGRLAERLEQAGIRAQVEDVARVHFDAARSALRERPLVAAAAAELEELARFVVERRH